MRIRNATDVAIPVSIMLPSGAMVRPGDVLNYEGRIGDKLLSLEKSRKLIFGADPEWYLRAKAEKLSSTAQPAPTVPVETEWTDVELEVMLKGSVKSVFENIEMHGPNAGELARLKAMEEAGKNRVSLTKEL